MKHKITPDDRRRIAQKVGVNEQYLYQCLTGRRDMKPEEAVRVEIESEGEITRFDLCQKTGLGIWPELAKAPANIAPVAPAELKPRVAPRRHDEKPSPYAHTDIDRREADGLTESERRAKAQAAAEAAKARGEA